MAVLVITLAGYQYIVEYSGGLAGRAMTVVAAPGAPTMAYRVLVNVRRGKLAICTQDTMPLAARAWPQDWAKARPLVEFATLQAACDWSALAATTRISVHPAVYTGIRGPEACKFVALPDTLEQFFDRLPKPPLRGFCKSDAEHAELEARLAQKDQVLRLVLAARDERDLHAARGFLQQQFGDRFQYLSGNAAAAEGSYVAFTTQPWTLPREGVLVLEALLL